MGPKAAQRHKIAACAEVDPRNGDDVKRTIYDCGLAYIGFNVPQSVMLPNQAPPQVWNYMPNEPNVIGGHAVVLAGYDSNGARVSCSMLCSPKVNLQALTVATDAQILQLKSREAKREPLTFKCGT